MTYKKEIRRMRWFVAMLLLVTAMVVPDTAWADGYDTNGFGSDGTYQPAIQVSDTHHSDLNATHNGYYAIENAGQLYWFAQQVNIGNPGFNAVLTENITVNTGVLDGSGNLVNDVSGFRSWTPIGTTDANTYTGTFDGKGNTISGLYFKSSSTTDYVGLFGINKGTIKSVVIVDSYIEGNSNVGSVCGWNRGGTIQKCHNKGTVIGNNGVGGVCGVNEANDNETASITECYNTGNVIGSDVVGGVCGGNNAIVSGAENATATITGCKNEGKVSGSNNVGGVCGKNSAIVKSGIGTATATIENSYHTGTSNVSGEGKFIGGVCGWNYVNKGSGTATAGITGSYNISTGKVEGGEYSDYTGGVCGNNEGGTIDGCYCTSKVKGVDYVGGVCGQNISGSINNSYNEGDISSGGGNQYIGGVCGYNDDGTIDTCHNTGEVECGLSTRYVGGVCGQNKSGTIKKCYNTGRILNQIDYAGGVCGWNYGGLITSCYNTGAVWGKGCVGGVCGSNNVETESETAEATITSCYNSGSVNGTEFVGGVCGYNRTGNVSGTPKATVTNCFNSGAVSGTYKPGGVCGTNGAVSGYATISNCYNSGTVSNGSGSEGGVCGDNNPNTNNENAYAIIKNCYFDNTICGRDAVHIIDGTIENVEGKSTVQFKSGEVCYLLNGSTTEGTPVWYQNINSGETTDNVPVLDNSHGMVYQSSPCTGVYSNTANNTAEHQYRDEDGICTNCGSADVLTITLPESLQHGAIKVYDEANADLTPTEGNTITVNGYHSLKFTAVPYETEVVKYKVKSFKYGDTDVPSEGIIKVKENITLTAEFELDWFVVGGMKYQVMDGGSEGNTVRVIGVTPDDKGAAIIPETVSYDEDGEGSVYEPVTYTIKKIGKDAFADMQGLTKLYVNSISPLSIESESTPFAGIASTVTLRVPYGAMDSYKAEDCPWNVFNDIHSFTMDGENNIVDWWRINVNTNNENFGEFKIYLPNAGELVPVVNNSEVPFGAALSLTVSPNVDEANGKAYATLSVKNGDAALTKEEGEVEVYVLTVGNVDLNIDIAFALKSFKDENLKYEVIELGGDKVKVTGKVGSATALTIPESVPSPDNNEQSYAVTQIADNAFANDSEITSVVIPASILSIGAKAFSGCSKLKEIIFTGTVPPTTIGEGAFDGIHADAIIMVPIASVDAYKTALGEALASKVIGDKGVITLTHNQGGKINVYVVNGDTETLQTPADGKVLVDWGTQVKIEAVADEGYVFERLKINNESLGIDVNTYTVRIMRYSPSTVSGQGENFGDITAEASFSVKIASSGGGDTESVLIKGSIDTTGGTQTIIVTHCDEGTESATIPEALGASGTTYIPVTSIAASAFKGCAVLKSVEIPSSITKIGSDAFKGCTSLESFKIKKTTTAMPSTSATRAAARAAADDVTVPVVDANAFDDIVDKATLYVPEGWKESFKANSEWGKFSKIKEYRDDENETVLAELTLTASAGGSLTVDAVTSTNDTQTVKVAESSDVTVTITPAEGYILSSLLYGGQDVTAQVSGGTLTLTSLEGENTLAAVFGVDTGIGAVYDMAKTVYVRDGRIIIDGAAAGEVVIVCDAAGRVLRREVANGEPIELPMAAGKVYIVRIGKQVFKLTM